MHFSLQLQNACCAFVKDISINAKYAGLVCLYNRVKQNTFLCAWSMTLAVYWPISPSRPYSNKETHYEGYVSKQYYCFAART